MSNAACLTRPRSFYALSVVSGITIVCYLVRHLKKTCLRQVASGSPRGLDEGVRLRGVLVEDLQDGDGLLHGDHALLGDLEFVNANVPYQSFGVLLV